MHFETISDVKLTEEVIHNKVNFREALMIASAMGQVPGGLEVGKPFLFGPQIDNGFEQQKRLQEKDASPVEASIIAGMAAKPNKDLTNVFGKGKWEIQSEVLKKIKKEVPGNILPAFLTASMTSYTLKPEQYFEKRLEIANDVIKNNENVGGYEHLLLQLSVMPSLDEDDTRKAINNLGLMNETLLQLGIDDPIVRSLLSGRFSCLSGFGIPEVCQKVVEYMKNVANDLGIDQQSAAVITVAPVNATYDADRYAYPPSGRIKEVREYVRKKFATVR